MNCPCQYTSPCSPSPQSGERRAQQCCAPTKLKIQAETNAEVEAGEFNFDIPFVVRKGHSVGIAVAGLPYCENRRTNAGFKSKSPVNAVSFSGSLELGWDKRVDHFPLNLAEEKRRACSYIGSKTFCRSDGAKFIPERNGYAPELPFYRGGPRISRWSTRRIELVESKTLKSPCLNPFSS